MTLWRWVTAGAALAALAACEGRERVRPVEEFFAEAAGPVRAGAAQAPREGASKGPALNPQARAAYERARTEHQQGKVAAMQSSLEEAVRYQPDFTEAWYNLGACRANRALQSIRADDEAAALEFFRTAVEAKRKAQGLMEQGVWFVYLTESEQGQVREDVDSALEDADEVMEDEAALLQAMRLWADLP